MKMKVFLLSMLVCGVDSSFARCVYHKETSDPHISKIACSERPSCSYKKKGKKGKGKGRSSCACVEGGCCKCENKTVKDGKKWKLEFVEHDNMKDCDKNVMPKRDEAKIGTSYPAAELAKKLCPHCRHSAMAHVSE